MSSSLILIWWYPDLRSNLLNLVAPPNKSHRSSILGIGNLFLIVRSLRGLQSTHILRVLSFLPTKIGGTPYLDLLSLINWCWNRSESSLSKCSFSLGDSLYIPWTGGSAPGMSSISCSTFLLGGNLMGSESRNTS